MKHKIEVQGHRGARAFRPENTIPSFEAALDAGVDSIETDLQLSRDGVWVFSHDRELSPSCCSFPEVRSTRTSTTRRVDRLPSSTLHGIVADRNPDPTRFPLQAAERTPLSVSFARRHFANPDEPYALPFLHHLFRFVNAYVGPDGERHGKTDLQRAQARRTILDLEIKCVPFEGTRPTRHLRALFAVIDECQIMNRCRLRSFDHRLVKQAKKLRPEMETAVLVAGTAPVNPAALAIEANARTYCPDYRFLDRGAVKDLHKAGIRVLPWTVNHPDEWSRLRDWGVDGITTDDPARLIAWLEVVSSEG